MPTNVTLVRSFIHALPILAAVTLIYGATYTLFQQNYRINANDPQIEMAEDDAAALADGAEPSSVLQGSAVDLTSSLAPFVITYNENGVFQVGNGTVNGNIPELPKGVLTDIKNNTGVKANNHEAKFTWETKEGLRFATVVKYYSGQKSGFVLVGRSLREVENRIDVLGTDALIAWAVTVAGILASYFIRRRLSGIDDA